MARGRNAANQLEAQHGAESRLLDFRYSVSGMSLCALPAQPVDATQAFSAGFFANPVDSATSSL